MKPILQNSLAVAGGLVLGSIANMSLISLSSSVIPPPEGADITSMEGLLASMHLFEPKHFLFPFLAHAMGTLVGAFIASAFVTKNKFKAAFLVAGLFFIGGAMNVYMLPAPLWFNLTDLVLAYFPMALLGYKLAIWARK